MSKLIAFFALFYLAFLVSVVAGPAGGDSILYGQLTEIMDERERLWFLPKPTGTRSRDISKIICPLVSEGSLESMASNSSVADGVSYNYFLRSRIYPARTKRWVIKNNIGEYFVRVLTITITQNNHCNAGFFLSH